MKKICCFLAVVFMTQGCIANDSSSSGGGVLVTVGEKSKVDKCEGPLLNVTSIDENLDEASKKYAVGNKIEISPGEHAVWYSCETPEIVGGRCFYSASLSKSEKIIDFSPGFEYLIFCDENFLLEFSRV